MELKTNKGESFWVDQMDLPVVSQFTWTLCRNGYLYGYKKGSGRGFRRPLLHRVILNPGSGIIDHIDGNKLNNARTNLRLANKSLNSLNRPKRNQVTSSKYKGVHFCQRTNRWAAKCSQYWLGRFKTEEEAARAYDAKAVQIFGEKIMLNFGGIKWLRA